MLKFRQCPHCGCEMKRGGLLPVRGALYVCVGCDHCDIQFYERNVMKSESEIVQEMIKKQRRVIGVKVDSKVMMKILKQTVVNIPPDAFDFDPDCQIVIDMGSMEFSSTVEHDLEIVENDDGKFEIVKREE